MNPLRYRAAPPCADVLCSVSRRGVERRPVSGRVLRCRAVLRLVLRVGQGTEDREECGLQHRNVPAHRQSEADHPAFGFDLEAAYRVRRLWSFGRSGVADQSGETVDGELGAAIALDLLEPLPLASRSITDRGRADEMRQERTPPNLKSRLKLRSEGNE